MRVWALISALLISQNLEARVFNFKNERFAGFFRGTWAMTSIGDDSFANSSGSQTEFDSEVPFNFSGELGFIFNLHQVFAVRLGAELLQTRPLEIGGDDAGGTKILDLESKVLVFNPNVTLEWAFKSDDSGRYLVFAGAGLAAVTLRNAYEFTGASPYGVADYTERGEASVPSYHLGIGFETLLLDTVTLLVEGGYRYLPISKFTYVSDVTSVSGAHDEGDKVVNDDGDTRSLDFSGPFVGLSFRFYIGW